MSKILDREKMQAAFENVGALKENRDSQRGSVSSETRLQDVALRIRNEIAIATLNWATVEAFNEKAGLVQDGLSGIGAWQPAKFAIKALVRDVIATLMRLTNVPQVNDGLESIPAFLILIDGRAPESLAEQTGAQHEAVASAMKYLFERLPTQKWSSQVRPDNDEILVLRNIFKPIRDGLIAHAKSYSTLDLKSDVKKTREFLRSVACLSDAACMISNIPRDDLDVRWLAAQIEAEAFWDTLLAGCRK